MSFNFGASAAKTSTSTFTAPKPLQTVQPVTFGKTANPSTGFNFGPIGTGTTNPATGFAFGTPAQSSGFAFGAAPSSTSSGFAFGAAPTTTSSAFNFKGFGTTTTAATGFGSFGGLTTTQPSFGTGFGFGAGMMTGLGSTQPQQQQPQVSNDDANLTNMALALSMPFVYNDERDAILSKWNRVQAFWGFGKGYYSSTALPLTFSTNNPFCRFKAIGYSRLPSCKNEDGLVGFIFNKKDSEICTNQQQMVDCIHRILQSKPTLCICVEGIKPLPEDKTEVIIYVLERLPSGASRRIPSSEFFTFTNQPTNRSQFTSMGVIEIIPMATPSSDQLKIYVDTPPEGIDPLIWQQAKQDNPDPATLIPVPMISFNELLRRLKCQVQETKLHQGRLDMIASDVSELQTKHSTIMAKLEDHKRKQLELGHRVLTVMVKQEITRKMGYGIQIDEEQLRVQLEAIYAELSAPTQFKGRLSELMSQIRMQSQEQSQSRGIQSCPMDPDLIDKVKGHLKQQQESLSHLISVIKDDFEDLKLICDSISHQQSTRG